MHSSLFWPWAQLSWLKCTNWRFVGRWSLDHFLLFSSVSRCLLKTKLRLLILWRPFMISYSLWIGFVLWVYRWVKRLNATVNWDCFQTEQAWDKPITPHAELKGLYTLETFGSLFGFLFRLLLFKVEKDHALLQHWVLNFFELVSG